MLITPSFQKSLIVEQFQGNFLNTEHYDYENRYCSIVTVLELQYLLFFISLCHIQMYMFNRSQVSRL